MSLWDQTHPSLQTKPEIKPLLKLEHWTSKRSIAITPIARLKTSFPCASGKHDGRAKGFSPRASGPLTGHILPWPQIQHLTRASDSAGDDVDEDDRNVGDVGDDGNLAMNY